MGEVLELKWGGQAQSAAHPIGRKVRLVEEQTGLISAR